jgi:phage terminase large subunit-like protein
VATRAVSVRRPRRRRPTQLAREVVAFAERLRVPEGEHVGRPLLLMPFQLDFITDAFRGGVRRAILSVARRNTKTATVAIIVLAALAGPLMVENSLVLSAARSRQQASVVFEYAKKMIRASGLAQHFTIRDAAKEIVCPRFGTTYRAISAEATTAVGYGVRLCIHDELGQVEGPDDALFNALTTAMGSYADSLEIIISTQAANDDDLFSILIDDALKADDPAIICHLHAAPKDCALGDVKAWEIANPAMKYGVRDRADLERQAAEAARLPSREAAFRNFILNQRVRAVEHFIPPALWDACSGPVDDDAFAVGPVFGGLDLSARHDLTALALVAQDREGRWQTRLHLWTPADTIEDRERTDRAPYSVWIKQGLIETMPGSMIDYAHLSERLGEICSALPMGTIMFDRWRIAELRLQLAKIGVALPLVEMGQGFKDFTTAVDAMETAVLNGNLRHGAHPVLRWSVANVAISRDHAGNRKFDKRLRTRRIDPAVALAMALRGATQPSGVADIASMIG